MMVNDNQYHLPLATDYTFHHFSVMHMQRYIDEFTFRLNEGNCTIDIIDRMSALCKNIGGKRLWYDDLVSNHV